MNEKEIKKKTPISAYLWVILGLIYTISPLDIIPDIPVLGWADDLFLLAATVLNLFEQKTEGGNQNLSQTLKYIKWVAIILGVIVVVLILLLGATLLNWFTK